MKRIVRAFAQYGGFAVGFVLGYGIGCAMAVFGIAVFFAAMRYL